MIEQENSLSDSLINRKGARKATDIPTDILALLQKGKIETVNLTEWLAIDHLILLEYILNELELQQFADTMLRTTETVEKKIMKIIPAIAAEWLNHLEQLPKEERSETFVKLSTHPSDSVRCWAAYIVGLNQDSLENKLEQIRPFAADHHFGVREIAWMAVRETVSKNLKQSIHFFKDWVQDEDTNIRRFAIEVIRPQGVWAKHISELKEKPNLALPLLEALKSDPEKYVQDSVGNWLNDASKTQPDFVIALCEKWSKESDTKATARIIKKAKRTIIKTK